MREDGKKVLPTFKDEIASGIGGSEAKLQHVKHQKFDQPAPSNQSDGRGSTPAASKPRSTKRRARRNNRNPARLDDGAARHPKWKRPNAQKNGVFADPLILPGEDPRQFEAIQASAMPKTFPSSVGPDGVHSAIRPRRKLRSRRFVQAKAISNSMRPDHPAFDEARGLIAFGILLCHEPETAFQEYASKYLRADKIGYLNQKFPRQNFESSEEWTVAVAEEIQSGLLPGTPGFAALDQERLHPFTEVFRSDIIKIHSFLTTIHMREFLDDDLEQQERLDKRIARLIDELIQIKTRKQVLRQTSTNGRADN